MQKTCRANCGCVSGESTEFLEEIGFVVNDHADKHLKGLRCSMLPYKDQGWMENIPLYGILGYIKHQYEAEGLST